MAATTATGRVRVASISEMTCIGIMYVCTKYGDFTIMCMIFSISARLQGLSFTSLNSNRGHCGTRRSPLPTIMILSRGNILHCYQSSKPKIFYPQTRNNHGATDGITKELFGITFEFWRLVLFWHWALGCIYLILGRPGRNGKFSHHKVGLLVT